MQKHEEVINLVDLRASRLSDASRLWIPAVAALGPLVLGLVATQIWGNAHTVMAQRQLGLLLRVALCTLAALCFINTWSRGVQRLRGGALRTSLAFLFLSFAAMSAAVGLPFAERSIAGRGDAGAMLLFQVTNFGLALLLLAPLLRTDYEKALPAGKMARESILAVAASLILAMIVGQLPPGGWTAAGLRMLCWLSLPALLYVLWAQFRRYRREGEPMCLAIGLVAVSGMAAQLLLGYAAGGESGNALLTATLIMACSLNAPLMVLISKDLLSLKRSLPAQVRLAFNGIALVVILSAAGIIAHIDMHHGVNSANTTMQHVLSMEQRRVVLLAAVTIAATCAAMLLATMRMRRFLDNVEDLVAATRELAQGRYGGLVHKNGEDELGVLNVAFNAMAERLYIQNRELRILAHVMDGTSDPVVVLGNDRHVIYANRAFTSETGWPRQSLIGCRYDTLFSHGDSRRRLISFCDDTEQGKSRAGELNIDIQGGGRLASFVTISPVMQAGRCVYSVAVHHDLGPLKQLEAERTRFTQSLLGLHRVARSVIESLDVHEVQRRAIVGLELTFGVRGRIWMKGAPHFCQSCAHHKFCPDATHCLHLFGTAASTLVCHPLNEGFLGRVMETSTPQICHNTRERKDDFLCNPSGDDMAGIRAGYPLIVGGETMGVLELAIPTEEEAREMEVFDLLAQVLSEAISNARNHERLSRQADKMLRMKEDLESTVAIEKQQAGELRRLNDRLVEADRIKNNFLSTTSHELRSPVSGMMGYLQLILDGMVEDRDEEIEFIQGAYNQAQLLLEVINDVLDLAKMDSGQMHLEPEQFDVSAFLNEVAATMSEKAQEKGLEMEFRIGEDLGEACADYVKMLQVFSIVLGNAIKFSDSGTIRIEARPLPHRGFVEFRVKDEGIGLDPGDRERVLEAFVQADGGDSRRFGGSGLGLTIAANLVSMMGGVLRLESEGLGCGMTAIIAIPRTSCAEHETSGIPAVGQTALVVDTDSRFIATARQVLEQIGAHVVVTDNAAEAFELAHRIEPTWVLSEMFLPHHNHPRLRNGLDLGRAILGDDALDMEFFLVTGLPEAMGDHDCEASLIPLLEKPVSAEELEGHLGILDMKQVFAMKPRLLYVGTDQDCHNRIRDALSSTPFRVQFSSHPEAAIHRLRSERDRVDLVLLDLSISGDHLSELLNIVKDLLEEHRIGVLLLHSGEQREELDAGILESYGSRVGVITRTQIEEAPQAFINRIVRSMSSFEKEVEPSPK